MVAQPYGRLACAVLLLAALLVPACTEGPEPPEGTWAGRQLRVFAGSAIQPALVEVAGLFEAQTGAAVLLHFGGSGTMLSQIALTGSGDLYLPGTSDFLDLARERGVLAPGDPLTLAYLLPVIGVARGNPLEIQGLADLARPGLRVGMGRPSSVCVGRYAVEILEHAGLTAGVGRNLVNQAESGSKTAQMLSLGLVDAVLGWDVFDDWDPARIETVTLRPQEVLRIGVVAGAVVRHSSEPQLAHEFLAFVSGPDGRDVFLRHGYLTDLARARALASPQAILGGIPELPAAWR